MTRPSRSDGAPHELDENAGRTHNARPVKNQQRPASVFFGLSSFQALAMFRRGIFYTFLGVYLRGYLGLSVTETTLFETIPMIFNILFQTFVWGRLTDKLQLRRSLIIAGELMAGVGHLVMWYLHSVGADPRASGWAIIWSLTVIEIFWSMSNIGWSAYISDVYTAEERNAVQGKLAGIGGVGRIIGAVLGGFLYDKLGSAYAGWGYKDGAIFFWSAAVMFVSTIPLFFMPEGGIGHTEAANARNIGAAGAGTKGDFRVFAVFLAAMLLVNSGVNSLAAIKGQFLDLKDGFAATPAEISLTSNVESLSLIAIGFFLGLLGRRLGLSKLLGLGAILGIAYLVLYAVAPSLGWIYPASVFKGLSDGCVAASSYAFASILIPPEKRGRYFAAYNATFSLSWGTSATFVTGPIIDGLSRAGLGAVFAYRMGALSSVATALVGFGLLLWLFALTRRRNAAPHATMT